MRHPLGRMRDRLEIGPRTYFLISAVALVALTLIVFTGAAVRVTGSGLGCPDWPNCYDNGRLVAELNTPRADRVRQPDADGSSGSPPSPRGVLAFFRAAVPARPRGARRAAAARRRRARPCSAG